MGVPKLQQRVYNVDPEHAFNNNNNYMHNNDITSNNIAGFYKGTKIFITGATGFVGKALVEKLLRSCDQLDVLYLLMRPKRGMTIEQRLKELIKNPVFNRIRDKNPDVFDKIKAVAGGRGRAAPGTLRHRQAEAGGTSERRFSLRRHRQVSAIADPFTKSICQT
jgi:hypothetical protein